MICYQPKKHQRATITFVSGVLKLIEIEKSINNRKQPRRRTKEHGNSLQVSGQKITVEGVQGGARG